MNARQAQAALAKKLHRFQKIGANYLYGRRVALLADEMGLGKAQPVSEIVLRPDGTWSAIGDLRVGDFVMGSNGLPTRVIGTYPQGRKKIYELAFDDGARARSTLDHLWAVRTPLEKWAGKDFRPRTLQEILDRGLATERTGKRVNKRWFIPVSIGAEFPEQRFEMHPYLLGALLANGNFTSSTVLHTGWPEQREHMRPYLPPNHDYRQTVNKWTCTIRRMPGAPVHNVLGRQIRTLGLRDHESHERFIPELYMRGSVRQRIDLLQGLFDNDGSISKDGMVIEYNTTAPKLAEQVLALVRSLGGVAWESTRRPKFMYKGVKKIGRVDHRIRVVLDFCPFRVSWKRERYRPRSKYPPSRAIVSVRAVGDEEAVCIAVDARDSLYITRDYVLTHNTIQAIAAIRPDEGALVVCPAFLMFNWRVEIQRFRPDLEVLFDVDLVRDPFPRPGQIAITAYTRLPETQQQRLWPIAEGVLAWGQAIRDLLGLGRAPKAMSYVFHDWDGAEPEHPVTLILDEAHYVKTSSSTRTERVRALAGVCSRVWALTGTPMINRPPELWALLQALQWSGKDVFGSWDNMVRVFSGRKLKYGGYDWHGPVLPEAVERLNRFMLRRTRAEVAPEIPKKSYRTIVVPVASKGVLGQDFSFLDGWSDEKVEGEATKPSGALFSARRELCEAKIAALEELLATYEEAGEPVVVFSYHTAVIEHLMFRRFWSVILGDTPMAERQSRVESFQAGKMRGLAGTIGAMGVGVTLTRAVHVVFVDRGWTPADNAQAEDRVCRIGQTRPVLVTILVADHPVDRRVEAVLAKKEKLLQEAGLHG